MNKRYYLLIALLLISISFLSAQTQTFTANGVSFKMVFVKGGTFTMGATSEQGSDASSDEKPAHRVTLSDYYIGQTEVTQALWQAVMGSNPSWNKGSNLPVEEVSWNDCQQFITKLNQLTGRRFRLPTEAEWEYAARGGSKSRGYKYSGSNDIGSVAWYYENSGSNTKYTHPVGQKQANELGIYDMSGNVWEWCQDWYDEEYYSKSPSTNPCNNTSSSCRVIRGDSWYDHAWYCQVSDRGRWYPGLTRITLGLRLVLSGQTTAPQAPATTQQNPKPTPTQQQSRSLGSSSTSSQNITVTANGVTFTMVFVKGGSFQMGATSEQGSDADSDEKPAHRVTLSDYYIGQTEVTQALWQAVMGSNPSYHKGDNFPVEQVSWDDCQQFITKLNQLTGRRFRLPTEAEWEYAARGGSKSRGYKYSGSYDIRSVAWYGDNSSSMTYPVGYKQANELGIYDMSGNVYEWCQDWYNEKYYSKSPSNNPCNNTSSSYRVGRGGSFRDNTRSCRVSNRSYGHPVNRDNLLGLRLALEADLVGSVESFDEKRSTPTPPIPVTVEPAQTTTHSPADTYQDSNGTEVTGPRSVIPDGEEMNDIYTMKVDDTTRQQQSRSLGSSSTSGQIIFVTANGVTFTMVAVQGGTFQMGATSEQGSDAESDEKPAHRVTLSDYYIGQTEVTQALWQAVMGSNPSNWKGSNLPVEQVSWNDCQKFITKLNQLTGRRFRLPTEAEWEYAARGGSKSRGYKYSGSNDIGSVAWYDGNSGSKTHPVGQKNANELGIYDMTGNVWEWCQDWYGSYGSSAQTNPQGPSSASNRVSRGGSWFNYARFCRVSFRTNFSPGLTDCTLGLRLAL